MIEGLPVGLLLQGSALLGAIVFIFYMVATGKSGTPREMREKNEEIRWLREALDEERAQKQTLLAERASVLEIMNSVRRMAEEMGRRGPP